MYSPALDSLDFHLSSHRCSQLPVSEMERLHVLAGHVAAHSFVGPSPAAPASSSSSADASTRVENAADPVKAVSGRGSETAPGALEAALRSGQLIDATATSTRKVSDVLPGPLQDQDREELLLEMQKASSSGQAHTQWMEWQEHYGDNGLSSNIVVPHLLRERNKDAICPRPPGAVKRP